MMYATPKDAELAFYDAFARGDIETMRAVWLDEDSIICLHPGSDILEGRAAVHASWEEILQNPPALRYELQWRSQGPLLAVHVGREWLTTGVDQTAVLATTNVLQITAEGWRMLLHQAAGLRLHEGSDPAPVH
ncbi:MAG: nuclear transport factor 2 family protein [Gammaproteobacteria bacterium]|nr:nuclear transport factor 2 family protein [Gammaproteobacteria bacterium]